MTIEEAIQHCKEVAAGKAPQGNCPECAAEHEQLAGWLEELIRYRAQAEVEKNASMVQNGCKYCSDSDGISPLDWMYGLDHIFPDYRFCPMCGREFIRKPEEAATDG